MSVEKQTLIVSGIRLPVHSAESDAFRAAGKKLSAARLPLRGVTYRVYRRSVDARRREDIRFVYSVAATGEFPAARLASLGRDISLLRVEEPLCRKGSTPLSHPPVVVGSGPAGLFCAYLLAKNGYCPLLLERGGDVEERVRDVELFWRERKLNEENNIQFGAGGAGTFSDGKLVTRINDPLTGWLFERLVEFGAPADILTKAKPHIGTDILRRVVSAVLLEICRLGGSVRFHAKVSDLLLSPAGGVRGVRVGGEEIPAEVLVLAIGNSARDTYKMLLSRGVAAEAKPFSVGVRIEHLQADIDQALYGNFAGDPLLGPAEYHLSHDTARRGVYTFCMCPGGEVVAAASEREGVVVNGMSYRARDGRNANSALLCSVRPEDYGKDPLAAMAFQREIEHRAFLAGGGNYGCPMITVGDFLAGRRETMPSRVLPTYMHGQGGNLALPEEYLPPFVVAGLQEGLRAFGQQIPGFDGADALLSGAETRTSAPLRLLRGEDHCALGMAGLYPCGEGAGYAGGITSAAIDGVKTAMAIIGRYRPLGE